MSKLLHSCILPGSPPSKADRGVRNSHTFSLGWKAFIELQWRIRARLSHSKLVHCPIYLLFSLTDKMNLYLFPHLLQTKRDIDGQNSSAETPSHSDYGYRFRITHEKKTSLCYPRSPSSITHSLQQQSSSRLRKVSRRGPGKLVEEVKRKDSLALKI